MLKNKNSRKYTRKYKCWSSPVRYCFGVSIHSPAAILHLLPIIVLGSSQISFCFIAWALYSFSSEMICNHQFVRTRVILMLFFVVILCSFLTLSFHDLKCIFINEEGHLARFSLWPTLHFHHFNLEKWANSGHKVTMKQISGNGEWVRVRIQRWPEMTLSFMITWSISGSWEG